MIAFDAGASGGFAFKGKDGNIHTIAVPKKDNLSKDIEVYDWLIGVYKMIADRIIEYSVGDTVYTEFVSYRHNDTPLTAYVLATNLSMGVMALSQKGYKTRLFRPLVWQQQLGIYLPAGGNHYKQRKKALCEFAKTKYETIYAHTMQKGYWKVRKCNPVMQTADALGILWVYSGDK